MPITTCDSPEILRVEFDTARKKVILDETEETWDTIAQGILHLTRLCNNGGCDFPSEMVAGIRSMSRPLNNALNSERSRLSGTAVEFLTALATGLGSSFDPLVHQFVPVVLALSGRTNRVFTSRARACILAIIQHTRLPSLLPYLAELVNHKSAFLRLTAAEGVLACLNCFNPPDLEKESRARVVEDFIKVAARDASADVRKASKEVFKAYKALMPARVDSFVAPLTPVVKKYLDLQTGPSGTHSTLSNTGQKQTSRPPSRTHNKVTEAGQRPASSTASRPSTRLITDNPGRSTKQRPAVPDHPTTAETRGPRQRTMSQVQREPPQPRGFHINTQSSSAAQRCTVPASAPTRQPVQHPQQGVARVLPAWNPSSTGGPQRPPPMQIKFHPPPDRLRVTGNGAKRIPLPSAPANRHASEDVAATSSSADRAGSTVDQLSTKLPKRNAKPSATGRLAVGRKIREGARKTSGSAKAPNGLVPTAPVAVQCSHKPSVKAETSNPQRRPAVAAQKGTRPPVKVQRKETSPSRIPLPPSPSAPPAEIPLPPSPDCVAHGIDPGAQDELGAAAPSDSADSTGKQPSEPCQAQGDMVSPSTPITALLSSIQRGFLFTPSSPLSPPQNYLAVPGNMQGQKQNTITANDLTKGPLAGVPFCASLQDDSAVDGLDRHALRDLN